MADAKIRVLARVVTHGPRYERIDPVQLESTALAVLKNLYADSLKYIRERAELNNSSHASEEAQRSRARIVDKEEVGEAVTAKGDVNESSSLKQASDGAWKRMKATSDGAFDKAVKLESNTSIAGESALLVSNSSGLQAESSSSKQKKRFTIQGSSSKAPDATLSEVNARQGEGTIQASTVTDQDRTLLLKPAMSVIDHERPSSSHIPMESPAQTRSDSTTSSVTPYTNQPQVAPTTAPPAKKRFVISGSTKGH